MKLLALSRGYNFCVTDKTQNKFEKPKCSVTFNVLILSLRLFFIHPPLSKSLEFFHAFVFKDLPLKFFKLVNKIKFSTNKDHILTENRCGDYFIPSSSCNLGYSGRIRRWLKARVDERRRKVKNKEIYIFFRCFSMPI